MRLHWLFWLLLTAFVCVVLLSVGLVSWRIRSPGSWYGVRWKHAGGQLRAHLSAESLAMIFAGDPIYSPELTQKAVRISGHVYHVHIGQSSSGSFAYVTLAIHRDCTVMALFERYWHHAAALVPGQRVSVDGFCVGESGGVVLVRWAKLSIEELIHDQER